MDSKNFNKIYEVAGKMDSVADFIDEALVTSAQSYLVVEEFIGKTTHFIREWAEAARTEADKGAVASDTNKVEDSPTDNVGAGTEQKSHPMDDFFGKDATEETVIEMLRDLFRDPKDDSK